MRYPSIDILRSLAIALMVLVHFLENLSGSLWTPAGFGAPLFAFLAGLSFRLWAMSRERKGDTDAAIRKVAVRRGLFLIGLGFAFNLLVWLPEDMFNWDVLTMIGTVLVGLAFARRLPGEILALAAGLLVLLSPFLRIEADYKSYWPDDYFDPDWTLPDVLVGYLSTGYFPLFPWAALPIAGYLAGGLVFPDPQSAAAERPSVRPLALIGGGFLAVTVLFEFGHMMLPEPVSTKLLTGWTMFPASLEYVCGVLGMAFVLFAALHHWVDRRQTPKRLSGLLAAAGTLSRHSLSLYLLHHLLHIWPLWLYGVFAGDEPTQFWRVALPWQVSVPLAGVCLVICYLFCRAADRWNWPTAEGVMRWVCD